MAEKETVLVLTDELRAQLAPQIKQLEDAAFVQGKASGVTAECERIKAVESQAMPGHEELIQTMKFDGKTTGPEAAVRVLAAEKAKKAARVTEIRADAPTPVPATAIVDPAKKEGSEGGKVPDHIQLAKEAQEHRAAQAKLGIEVSNVDAVKFVYQRAGAPLK